MFSILRPTLVYKDISSDIMEHDIDHDSDQWSYDGRDVYRGTFDPTYSKDGINVHWLYDDDLKRVGLVEHDAENPEVFHTLWIYDNPFATLFQDLEWKSEEKTLWSLLSNEAYQDCLEDDFKTVFDRALNSGTLLVTPEMLTKELCYYECETCGKKSLSSICQSTKKSFDSSNYSILFLDDSFILYTPPSDFSLLGQRDAFAREQQEVLPPAQQPAPEECLGSPDSPQQVRLHRQQSPQP
jgi:hypothetical protein